MLKYCISQSVFVTWQYGVWCPRFMADMSMVGCNWVQLPAGKYSKRTEGLTSRSQLEVDIAFNDLISHPAAGEWMNIAPFRILSFDIECAGRKGIYM